MCTFPSVRYPRFKERQIHPFLPFLLIMVYYKLAEREGFEPSVPFRVHTTSNRAPSAARSSLQFVKIILTYFGIFIQGYGVLLRSRGDSGQGGFGAGGIRTPGTLASSMVFETISFNHSDTAPVAVFITGNNNTIERKLGCKVAAYLRQPVIYHWSLTFRLTSLRTSLSLRMLIYSSLGSLRLDFNFSILGFI